MSVDPAPVAAPLASDADALTVSPVAAEAISAVTVRRRSLVLRK